MKRSIRIVLSVAIGLVVVLIAATYISSLETEDTFRTCKLLAEEDIDRVDFNRFDSVTVAANTLYKASGFKELMQGEQYRDAWAAPITVPIAFLDTLKGGLRIIEEGGGQQTHSLELEDKLGIRYALRSLSKDSKKLVPDFARDLGLENIIVDGVSAQHPYAALVVAELSAAAGLLHTRPELMFLPKQKGFGELNDKYGNRLYFLEYESEGKVDWTGISGVRELVDTDDLIELRSEIGNDISIDKNALVRARLFDILIGDWDRHAKQWGWALKETNETICAVPVPTDRDNAFFKQDGILPSLIANDYALPKVQPFGKDIDYLPGLVRGFDEYFLRVCSRELFVREAEVLKHSISDSLIEDAFKVWPERILELDGPEIKAKLRARRDELVPIAKRFHNILDRRPLSKMELNGCEDLELFGSMVYCFDCGDEIR